MTPANHFAKLHPPLTSTFILTWVSTSRYCNSIHQIVLITHYALNYIHLYNNYVCVHFSSGLGNGSFLVYKCRVPCHHHCYIPSIVLWWTISFLRKKIKLLSFSQEIKICWTSRLGCVHHPSRFLTIGTHLWTQFLSSTVDFSESHSQMNTSSWKHLYLIILGCRWILCANVLSVLFFWKVKWSSSRWQIFVT